MKQVTQLTDIPQTDKPIVLAMGCFDGVHIGHQQVIATAVEQSHGLGGEAWVYTFNPHPAKVLVPEKAPALISAEPCRLRQMEALGVHGIVEIPFTREFASLQPEEFLSTLRNDLPALAGIVCGFDWSFGYRASGNFQTLETFCAKHNLHATAIQPVLLDGERVSSTHIRNAVRDGNIPMAEHLLGRPFCLFGTVVKGRGIGRTLGYPTANIEPLNELLPSPGIYAAWTKLDGRPVPSAVFIGERTTFEDPTPVVEVYLIDFEGDLYGQTLETCLTEHVRGVERFDSKDALIEQIGKDVQKIRSMLNLG